MLKRASTPDQETRVDPSEAVTRPLMFDDPRVIVVIPSAVTQAPTTLHDTETPPTPDVAVIVTRRRTDSVSVHEGHTSSSYVPAVEMFIAKLAVVTPSTVTGLAWSLLTHS